VRIGGRSAGETAYALNARGLALLKMNKLEEAQSDFKLALKLVPHFGDAMLHLGVTYLLQGNSAQALEILQRAKILLPGDPKVEQALEKAHEAYDLLRSSNELDKIER
jgi:Flp pilus assembly protein TadD